MTSFKVFSIIVGLMIIHACSTPKDNVMWVGGFKSECADGTQNSACLNVIKGEDLKNENWESINLNIENFEFEEGMMKKIVVKKETLDSQNASNNITTVKYTFVKELAKRKDPRIQLIGNWDLRKLNDVEINKKITIPGLKVNLKSMKISGNGGCNLYSAKIENLTSQKIRFKQSLGTLMECGNGNIEPEYLKTLDQVETYKIDGETLLFYDKSNNVILTFTKAESLDSNLVLDGRWSNIRIQNEKIEPKGEPPYIVFNIQKMSVSGRDGCNIFNGEIKDLNKSELLFGPLAFTKKMCLKMEVPDQFQKAINQVAGYKIKDKELILVDSKGNELLAFLK